MQPKISILILTKDSQERIRHCLESVKWADEIIVVDDLSSDRTLEICREYTDKIFQRRLDNFGLQRQFSLEKSTGEWALFIDTDEVLSLELQDEIRKVVSSGTSYDGFYIWRKTFYLGKWIRYCNWYVPVLRMFRREKASFEPRKVHEKVFVSGKLGYFKPKAEILHYSYDSIEQYVEKMNLYSSLEAKELFTRGRKVTLYNAMGCFAVRPAFSFVRKFILMLGFLDGLEGLLISMFTAIFVFLSYAKLWELQNQRK